MMVNEDFLLLQKAYQEYWLCLQKIESQNFTFSELTLQERRENEEQILKELKNKLDPSLHHRLDLEILSFGPLTNLLDDEDIAEILVNGINSIWVEKQGQLHQVTDAFMNIESYKRIVERLCDECKVHLNLEQPQADGKFRDFRFSIVGPGMTEQMFYFSLRRHPKSPWSLDLFTEKQWASASEIQRLRQLVHQRSNFLIVGGTGCGKTSLLNALLKETSATDRAILIEDTLELAQPNAASIRLLTRNKIQNGLEEITQTDLIKKSLRLRPDRLVMGEIRGSEAKDFLLMLSTGHHGCMGTLHANDPQQALSRIEMLVQMGAPQWSLTTIRRLIFLSLQFIVVVEKTAEGLRKLKGIYRIQSLEEMGFLIEKWD